MNKKNLPKRLILFFLAASVLGGFIFKAVSTDCGISELSGIEALRNYDITLNYAWNESDQAGATKDAFGEDYGVDHAQVIAVVSPTGNFIQTEGSIGQEFTIDRVLRGNSRVVAEKNAYVYKYSGFQPVNGNIEFCGDMNLMMPGNQYLIFMDASPLNEYQKENVFLLVSENFGYIKIDAEPTHTLDTDYKKYQFGDLAEYEFFSTSDTVTDALNDAREELLEKYL